MDRFSIQSFHFMHFKSFIQSGNYNTKVQPVVAPHGDPWDAFKIQISAGVWVMRLWIWLWVFHCECVWVFVSVFECLCVCAWRQWKSLDLLQQFAVINQSNVHFMCCTHTHWHTQLQFACPSNMQQQQRQQQLLNLCCLCWKIYDLLSYARQLENKQRDETGWEGGEGEGVDQNEDSDSDTKVIQTEPD